MDDDGPGAYCRSLGGNDVKMLKGKVDMVHLGGKHFGCERHLGFGPPDCLKSFSIGFKEDSNSVCGFRISRIVLFEKFMQLRIRRQYQRRLRSISCCVVRERVRMRLPCTPFGMEQFVHA
eukprot:1194787-Prorocentrum_minimum.AAC.1